VVKGLTLYVILTMYNAGAQSMVETTTWNGQVYRRYPESERLSDRVYFQRMGLTGAVRLHRDVWSEANGPIPDGHHVHHIDGDTLNNDISNLECLTPADHRASHPWSDERRRKQCEHLATIRPLTKAWHASPEGRSKNRETGAMAYDNFVSIEKPCAQCETAFMAKALGNRDRFCSNKCRAKWRRDSGVDNEARDCIACAEPFTVSRYSKVTTCSRSCGARMRAKTLKARKDQIPTP
jgi:hypothetical protein